MKVRIFVVLILVVAAALAGHHITRPHINIEVGGGDGHEDTRQTFKLDAGAQVDVHGINGSVEITTAATDTADVHIIRTAGSQEDLDSQPIIIERTSSSLSIHSENNHRRGFWNWLRGHGSVRTQVILALPRQIELKTNGVNGPVTVGELDGGVEMSGINGRVEVGQATGHSVLTGINGSLKVTAAQLGAQGLNVSGINGGVEIRLPGNLNADVSVAGLNGSFALDVPNVTMQEKINRSNMRARIGTGGTPITVSGVNGSVRFEPAATSDAGH